MGKWFLLVVSALTVGAVLLCAPAFAASPPPDRVTGQAVIVQFPFSSYGTNIRLDARSGPSGQNPTGTVGIYQCLRGSCGALPVEIGGAVTCMNVQGKRAIIGYYGAVYRSPFFPFPVFERVRGLVEVLDNGPPSERGDQLTDQWRHIQLGGSEPDVPFTTCPATLPSLPASQYGSFALPPSPDDFYWGQFANSPQDFTVTDAQEPRFFKFSDCRLGGWARIGFKSRRQCDNFVRWQCRDGRHDFYGFPTIYHCRQAIRS